MSTRVVTPATILVGAFLLALIGGGLYTYITRADTPSRVPFTLALPSSFATGTTALSPSDYTIRSAREVEYVNDGAILAAIPEFQAGWKTLAFSLLANRAIASERVTRAITLDDTSLTSHFTLDGLSVATNYKVMPKAPNTRSLDNVAALVKQTVTLENTTDDAIVTDLVVTHIIPVDSFTYDGATYTATEAPQSFKAYQKTASIPEYAKDIGYPDPEKAKQWERLEHTYTAGTRITWETADGRTAIYDWSDAVHLAHEVTVHKEDGRTILTFRVTDITVPAHGKTEIDPNYALSNAAAYGTRVDGATTTEALPTNIAIGDVNGDGKNDLVLGAYQADNNGLNAGSVYVIFSTLLDSTGTSTGNLKPLSIATNYNIRFDGSAASENLSYYSALSIGDVNGDGLGDLVIGAQYASKNGAYSGSVYVMFSTLIDDVGISTGNNKPLSTATNYNIRYDGLAANGYFGASLAIGDVNGNDIPDLLIGDQSSYGNLWVLFSSLIDDVGTSTGNIKLIGTGGNYNIRYNTNVNNDWLASSGSFAVGDVNGDGLNDLVVGASGADNNGASSGSVWVMFSTLIDNVTTTGNLLLLSTASNYNIRYSGANTNEGLAVDPPQIGDVNGDGLDDLVIGATGANHNGEYSGSAYVFFSTLIDDVGTSTGNNKPLSTATNYNIRYDGDGAWVFLTEIGSLAVGDVNGDGKGDLVLGTYDAISSPDYTGSVWVIFSSLIDDVGATTGNNKPLSTATNYNIRYDGGSLDERFSYPVRISDVNGDNNTDLIIGASRAAHNGSYSGSVFLFFSSLIDDAGTTKGNIYSLDTPAHYSVRFDGGAASDSADDIVVGDLHSNGARDLVIFANGTDYNGADSGSAYIIPSTLLRAQAPQPQIQIRGGAQIRGKVSFQTHRPFNCGVDTVSDVDGNVYNTVKIGSQCWMKQNLRVGTMITGATTQTNNSTIEKWCYNNTLANCMTTNNPNHPDGGLYQWNEAMQYSTTAGAQGICPAGWHIPTHDEFTTLERAVCTSGTCATDFPYNTTTTGYRGTTEGTKLKPNGTSGFEFNLAGLGVLESFGLRTSYGYVWSSSESGADAWRRFVYSGSAPVGRDVTAKSYGLPVRCLKD